MVRQHKYYVYILASLSKVLYVGVTHDVRQRVLQHRLGMNDGFTKKYKVYRLVYIEYFPDITKAIAREKELKGWRRIRKIELIEKENKQWNDLFELVKKL